MRPLASVLYIIIFSKSGTNTMIYTLRVFFKKRTACIIIYFYYCIHILYIYLYRMVFSVFFKGDPIINVFWLVCNLWRKRYHKNLTSLLSHMKQLEYEHCSIRTKLINLKSSLTKIPWNSHYINHFSSLLHYWINLFIPFHISSHFYNKYLMLFIIFICLQW